MTRGSTIALATALLIGCTSNAPSGPASPPPAPRPTQGGYVFDAWPAEARRAVEGSERSGLPDGFAEELVIGDLVRPTAFRFMPDGRIAVAEQRGTVRLFDPAVGGGGDLLLDLRTAVFNRGQQGLLGLAIDPDFESQPFIYVGYTRDAPLGGVPPTYGLPDEDEDDCPAGRSACPASGRLARFALHPDGSTGIEEVLIDDWCITGPNHTLGNLVVAPDGALIVSGGDGADGATLDYGQLSTPPNACADPPASRGEAPSPPTSEGGALRSQDLLTRGDPLGLDGTIIRIDRATGDGLPDNPLARDPDDNARRVIAHGMRNPFRFTFRPHTSELWVADVGWNQYEEINRLVDPLAGPPANLGWPCYEGPVPQPAFAELDFSICRALGQAPGELTFPLFSFGRTDTSGSCSSPAAALSGIAFYEGIQFPPEYAGALFIGDTPRQCLWVMTAASDGLPDPTTVREFRRGAAPVDMAVGDDGALYYLDVHAGALRRIVFDAGR